MGRSQPKSERAAGRTGQPVLVPGSDDLQRLVDHGRFDDLLREVTLADAARAWMRYQHRCQAEGDLPGLDDPDWWAVDAWMDEGWWADESRVRVCGLKGE